MDNKLSAKSQEDYNDKLRLFIKNDCWGKQFDTCEPCIYRGSHSRTHGGFECLHPKHPDNENKS